jgi:methionyl-tRNA synthetase
VSNETYYLTTAIDYASAPPHLGHAYEKIAADMLARHYRQRGRQVHFLTGLDEHGTKIQKAAAAKGVDPQTFVDTIAQTYVDCWADLGITYDQFIRTSSPEHRRRVQAIFTKLQEKGAIYKASYEGLYCTGCEAFILERDLVDGNCPNHQRAPETIIEENYFFKLSEYKERIRAHIESHTGFLQPDTRRNEILNMLKDFEDFSISRSAESVGWGIPVPGDEGQIIYVWLDALSNYITAIGYPEDEATFSTWWPADNHLVGKDITKFHAIIWPAMLLALDVPLPKMVYGHGFVSVGALKMSKTVGNVVDPREIAATYKPDALRYYLMRDIPFGKDGDFTTEAFETRIDADLANNLGNALNRLLPILEKQFDGQIQPDNGLGAGTLKDDAARTVATVAAQMDAMAPHEAIAAIWQFANAINKHVDTSAPWALAKDPEKRDELAGVLTSCLEALRLVAILAWPVIPNLSAGIWSQLGLTADLAGQRWSDLAWGGLPAGTKVNRQGPIYPRVGTAIAGADKKAAKA